MSYPYAAVGREIEPKVDRPLVVCLICSSALFALSLVTNLPSGPRYFGVASALVAVLCAFTGRLTAPRKGRWFILGCAVYAVFNTIFAVAPLETFQRWILWLVILSSALKLTELPSGVFRATIIGILPWCLALQVLALQYYVTVHMDSDPGKSRLVWHTIGLYAGLLITVGFALPGRFYKACTLATGMALFAQSGARGGLVGLGIAACFWMVAQPARRKPVIALLALLVGILVAPWFEEWFSAFSSIKVVGGGMDPIRHFWNSGEHRWLLLQRGLEYFESVSFTGAGLGPAYQGVFRSMTGLSHPHNAYLALTIQTGVVGGIVYAGTCSLALLRATRARGENSLRLLLAPTMAYYFVRGMAEDYSLVGMGNFASVSVLLLVAWTWNHSHGSQGAR